jgi:hypothetical protein
LSPVNPDNTVLFLPALKVDSLESLRDAFFPLAQVTKLLCRGGDPEEIVEGRSLVALEPLEKLRVATPLLL